MNKQDQHEREEIEVWLGLYGVLTQGSTPLMREETLWHRNGHAGYEEIRTDAPIRIDDELVEEVHRQHHAIVAARRESSRAERAYRLARFNCPHLIQGPTRRYCDENGYYRLIA